MRPCRYFCISKIYFACSGLTLVKFSEISTSAGSLSSLSCLITSSVCYIILLSVIILFDKTFCWFIEGNIQWLEFYWLSYDVQWWGHSYFHKSFLCWTKDFQKLYQWFSEIVCRNSQEKRTQVNILFFTFINSLNGKKPSRHWKRKSGSYLTFVVDTFNKYGFNTVNVKSVFARNYVRQWCFTQGDNWFFRNMMIKNNTRNFLLKS